MKKFINEFNAITIQDDSPSKPYDMNDLAKLINTSVFLLDMDQQEGPMQACLNKIYATCSLEEYNKFMDTKNLFIAQMGNLFKQLKGQHLPITFLNIDFYLKEWNRIKLITNNDVFEKELETYAKSFSKTLEYANKVNTHTQSLLKSKEKKM